MNGWLFRSSCSSLGFKIDLTYKSLLDADNFDVQMIQHGNAYLFDKVVNVTIGEKEERMMMTGLHTVVDIFCVGCGSLVGWKYVAAYEKSQKYKEGKYILERFQVLNPDGTPYVNSQDGHIFESDTDDV